MEKLLGEQVFSYIKDPTEVCEIRLRLGSMVEIITSKNNYHLPYRPTKEYLDDLIKRAMSYSPYAYEEEVSAGYIHYKGGIRIGIAGTGSVRNGGKITFRTITSLCIRIPHQFIGISLPVGDFYSDYKNTLVISPPCCGKTTLIRDMGRVLSERYQTLFIDERGELCSDRGIFTLGDKSDVICGIPKEYLYENVIRAMSPEVVICDELFSENDFVAISSFNRAGIKCLASYHADSIDKLPDILKQVFDIFIILTNKPCIGTIKGVKRK